MTNVVAIDMHEVTVTPVFKYLELENVPKSESAGRLVKEMKEVVEVRFAGNKNYSPHFPTDAFWKREGNRTITYAERWPEQYRAFKEGNPQEANGTPLEMLRDQGITPEQLSLCRALKIYSVEALYHLEGSNLKSLGMNANSLKSAARAFMADRNSGANMLSQIEALQAQIAELQARSTEVPENDPTPAEIEDAIQAADEAYAGLSDDDLKVKITDKTGVRPRGNPSRLTLERTLRELEAA